MFTFPNPVNEVVARTVAGFVLVTAIVYVTTSSFWVLVFLLSGFLVRVASGPRYSPTAWVAIHMIVPRLPFGDKPVSGPPKRFAQGIGVFMVSAAALVYLLGFELYASGLVGVLMVFAALECIFGFCAGCHIFRALMRLRIIPESICIECNLIGKENNR